MIASACKSWLVMQSRVIALCKLLVIFSHSFEFWSLIAYSTQFPKAHYVHMLLCNLKLLHHVVWLVYKYPSFFMKASSPKEEIKHFMFQKLLNTWSTRLYVCWYCLTSVEAESSSMTLFLTNCCNPIEPSASFHTFDIFKIVLPANMLFS